MVFAGGASAVLLGLIGNWRSRAKEHERASRALYAITDRRAIIWSPEPKGNAVRIRTIPRGEIYNLVRLENPDGSGSVLFSSTQGRHDARNRRPVVPIRLSAMWTTFAESSCS